MQKVDHSYQKVAEQHVESPSPALHQQRTDSKQSKVKKIKS